MTTFKPYPELTLSTEDGVTRITTKGGEDVLGAGRPEDLQRFVDCWNACRKLFAPAAHIEATDAQVHKLENLRKEAWSRSEAIQAELDRLASLPAVIFDPKWNHDVASAPRGTTFKRNRIIKDKIQEIEEFIPDHVWIATKCQKVLKSYFIPQAGKTPSRWSGLATGEEPVAWQAFVVPVHPYASKPEGIAA